MSLEASAKRPALARMQTAPAPADRWEALKTLIRARLLVATLALPIGVLLRPDATFGSWWVLWWSLIAVGVLSAGFWLGTRLRRGHRVQTYLQLGSDLVLVTALSALTGARDSQFILFYALVVITGGVLGSLPGGLFAAAGACAAFVALPWIASELHAAPSVGELGSGLRPGMLVAFLTMVGVLAGILGQRVRRAREDLERTARELKRVRVDNDAILRHLTTGVLTVDRTGRIAYLNPAAEQVLGVPAGAARDRPIEEALPDRLRPLREEVSGALRRRRPRVRAELMMAGATDRPLPLGISTNLLTHDREVTGVVAVFQDLTEVREMERRMRRSETLAELGALAAGIAHELRNGLNPISGSVECLQRELRLEGENAELMALIGKECSRLNRFVTDLLSYSRERDLVLEAVDLNQHLGEICDLVAHDVRAADRVQVRFEAVEPPVAVRVDREQIRQVWLNLASNALQAMESGGALRVRWRAAEPEQVHVEFIDEGSGIAAEDLPRVGQPFFTTKEGGTGLGLAIAQRIVERHGGSLMLESAPGRGTTARVTLPCAEMSVAQAA